MSQIPLMTRAKWREAPRGHVEGLSQPLGSTVISSMHCMHCIHIPTVPAGANTHPRIHTHRLDQTLAGDVIYSTVLLFSRPVLGTGSDT